MKGGPRMAAYALAHVRQVMIGPPIEEYLRRIDATLEPFGGRFIVHGGRTEVLEGSWSGDLIILEFPDPSMPPPTSSMRSRRRSIRTRRTCHLPTRRTSTSR